MPGGLKSISAGPAVTIDGDAVQINKFNGMIAISAGGQNPVAQAYRKEIAGAAQLTDPGVTLNGSGVAVDTDKEVTDVHLHLGDRKSIQDDRFTIRREDGSFQTVETEVGDDAGQAYIYAKVDLDGDGDLDEMRQDVTVTKNAQGKVKSVAYGPLEYIYTP